MFGSSIEIAKGPVTISAKESGSGGLRITYPRCGKVVLGVLLLLAGAGIWLAQLPEDATGEPLQYALFLLLIAPGLWGISKALRLRPVVRASGGELTVTYGPAFFERVVARLPLESLEVRVTTELAMAVRYDAHALSKRLLAALNPFASGRLPESEVKLHILQVRNTGQELWLSLFGSQVASEVENARLAIRGWCGGGDSDLVDAEAVEDVSPSP